MSRINPLDRQTVYETGTGDVDRAASAKENLRSGGEHLWEMRLDKTMDALRMYSHGAALRDMRDMGYEVEGSPELMALKGVAMFPVGLVRDALEIAVHPLLAVKDFADAAIHGIASLFRRS